MRFNPRSAFALIGVLAGILSACGENRFSPTSPSLMSPASGEAPRPAARFAPRRIDSDGDGYEDPDPGMPPDPGTIPIPAPGPLPTPEGIPPPGGPPVPVQLTVSVVGLLGNLSFAPNPLQATIGNTVVWMNNDVLPHDIVFDDGTPIGNLAPGQSSLPIPLMTATASYHCTIHPSMTGQIVAMPAVPPGEGVPTDPSQMPVPVPDPSGQPLPPDPYGDGYDDGYDYDYY